MLSLDKATYNKDSILDELLNRSGVVVIKNVYSKKDIDTAREIINKFAENQEQKESHFNAEAEASGKIQLQQRVWNLFGKGEIFSKLITNDIIFTLMSKQLGFFSDRKCVFPICNCLPIHKITAINFD